MRRLRVVTFFFCWVISSSAVLAQVEQDSTGARICDQPVSPPASLPADGSGPVVYLLGLCFSTQANTSAVEPETYMFHVQLRPSRPSLGEWVPYDETATSTMLADFRRLWDTKFLDDLSIEVNDYVFSNGVVGKLVTYHLEERDRIKFIDYNGGREVDRSKVDERLRERGITLQLDSFLDLATVERVKAILKTMMAEKGFTASAVTHSVVPVAGGPKLVRLTFNVDTGPQIKIRDIEFTGNTAIGDGELRRKMKENKPAGLLSWITGAGTYKQAEYEEDAEKVEEHYRNEGYARANVGQPVIETLATSSDGKTRWVRLRIPVTEGRRYRVADVDIDGNTIVADEPLRALFDVKPGDWYSDKVIRKGLEKAREIYGAAGYMEFTGFPDLVPADEGPDSSSVRVTLRLNEGTRYLVNRITFTGNTTTHDRVIRREMQLLEGGVFNTEALKYSIQRLNQLGYFKPLEGREKDLKVEKAPGRPDAVDVTLRLEEQNRNQVTFGGGVSQYDGVFGNLSYTTSNFLGRGESLTVIGQRGARSSVYQLTFTEPFVFNRPMTAGFDLFSRKIDYLTSANSIGYSEVRNGTTVTAGYALFRFSRAFLNYAYEVIDTAMSDDLLDDLESGSGAGLPLFNPFRDEGRHIESRVTPSVVHNTIDNPIRPRRGKRLSLNAPIAGGPLGGTTDYIRPEVEGVLYVPHLARTALGLRVSGGWVHPYADTRELPYYLRFFLGGENQIRGVDIRTVGPTDPGNRARGGNKFGLFNAEYYFDFFGPVRVLAFHDAGQAFSEGERIDIRQFRTSSGVEARFMVPMLNVPFRLIYAWNIYRDSFQPPRAFKFAVGTAF